VRKLLVDFFCHLQDFQFVVWWVRINIGPFILLLKFTTRSWW